MVYEQTDEITDQMLFQPERFVLNQQHVAVAAGHRPQTVNHEGPISKQSSMFVFSRGCPIRYLSQFETNERASFISALGNEDADEKEKIQHANAFQETIFFNQLDEVSTITFVLHEVLHQLAKYWLFFHLFIFSNMHICHCKLRKKGQYFCQPVNGFI